MKKMYNYDRSVDIPKGTLLAVEHFAFEFVAFLVDSRLRLGLHEYEFPLSGEHLLQSGQIFGLVVGQFQSRLVLHRPFAQVDGVVGVLRLPAVARPEIRRLYANKSSIQLSI